jgi:TolB-like protein/DNA-binding SARP family transcriptional activator
VPDSLPQVADSTRFRLKTFGTLALTGRDDDTVLGKHGHHHRRLALLAVLAAAGATGKSRDQLLLLFWPESTQTRARHSLDQLLYAIRGSLDEAIFDGANPVRLNPAIITSDVLDFTAAVRHQDFEGAASIYGGPFLEGFNLSDAPEFEHWMESERSRLSQLHIDALQKLAQQSKDAGDLQGVVRWCRRIYEADPYSTRASVDLMTALSGAGDKAAALQHADRYQALIQKELNAVSSPEVAALAATIRTRQPRDQSQNVQGSSLPEPPADIASPPATSLSIQSSAASVAGTSRARVVTLALFVSAVIAIALWILPRDKTAPADTPSSIAVLPIQNLSTDAQDASLGDGLTEELIAVLAKIPGLRVISRTSSFAFRNATLSGQAIGDSLHVTNLLEGSVQKRGSGLRIQVRLIDTRDGSTQWSETYERSINDMFAVQSEIAAAVADELNLRMRDTALARIKRGATSNIAAYELYLRGNDPARTRSDSAVREGITLFEQAIELDSNYAAAYAGLARLHMRLSARDPVMSSAEHINRAKAAIRKALQLDETLADAHASNSFLMRRELKRAAEVSELERAVALDPTNSRLREWLSQSYIVTGKVKEAKTEALLAVSLDPLSATANAELAHTYLANNQCDEALARLAPLATLKPPLLRVTTYSARCFLRKGMMAEAVAEVNRTAANSGATGIPFRAYVLARAGYRKDAEQLLRDLRSQAATSEIAPTDIALVYAGLGYRDEAFKWLDKPLDGDLWLNIESVLEALADDPRIDDFRKRVGLQKR